MKTEYQNRIVGRIRKLRLNNNCSQARLSTILGISPGQVGNIETPTRSHKYTISQISAICFEFNERIENLFLTDADKLSPKELIDSLINCIIEYEK